MQVRIKTKDVDQHIKNVVFEETRKKRDGIKRKPGKSENKKKGREGI